MTAPPLRVRPGGAHMAARRRLPGTVAFYLLASIIIGFLAGYSAPPPLNAVYAAPWNVSPKPTPLVLGV